MQSLQCLHETVDFAHMVHMCVPLFGAAADLLLASHRSAGCVLVTCGAELWNDALPIEAITASFYEPAHEHF